MTGRRTFRRTGRGRPGGAHYRDALPPEKWPKARAFLVAVKQSDARARARGQRLDVGRLLRFLAARED